MFFFLIAFLVSDCHVLLVLHLSSIFPCSLIVLFSCQILRLFHLSHTECLRGTVVARMQSLWKAVPFLASSSYSCFSVFSWTFSCFLIRLEVKASFLHYYHFFHLPGAHRISLCRHGALAVCRVHKPAGSDDSDLLTYTQWQDQNRPVHTFHKPDGSFECVLVFAWDKSVSIHTYLPSHTYEIHL